MKMHLSWRQTHKEEYNAKQRERWRLKNIALGFPDGVRPMPKLKYKGETPEEKKIRSSAYRRAQYLAHPERYGVKHLENVGCLINGGKHLKIKPGKRIMVTSADDVTKPGKGLFEILKVKEMVKVCLVSPLKVLPCAHCSKPFLQKNIVQRYCCNKCRVHDDYAKNRQQKIEYQRSRYKTQHKVNEPKKCAFCGDTFVPKKSNTKYCTPNCSKTHYLALHYDEMLAKQRKVREMRPKKVYVKKCPYCGETFETTEIKKKFCCRKHFKRWYHNNVELPAKEKELTNFPIFMCAGCHKPFQLDYDPVLHSDKFLHLICPNCGKNPRMTYDDPRLTYDMKGL